MSYDDMDGPELAAAVAEKVMGWTAEALQSDMPGGVTVHALSIPSTWRPDRDIAAAWEVVEKMAADGWTWNLGGGVRKRFMLTLHDIGKDVVQYSGEADTAPRAICLAALKAVEAQEA